MDNYFVEKRIVYQDINKKPAIPSDGFKMS